MLLVIRSIRIVQHFVPGVFAAYCAYMYVTKAGEEPVNKDAITTQKYYRSLQG